MFKMIGDTLRLIEYRVVEGYRNVEKDDHRGYEEIISYLKVGCPKNIKLIPLQSDLDVQISPQLSYQFAFEVGTATPVSRQLFYEGNQLD